MTDTASFQVSFKTDVWSLACVAYEVFNSDSSPFLQLNDESALTHAYRLQRMSRPLNLTSKLSKMPPAMNELLERCLSHSPESRPDIKMLLTSSFFRTGAIRTLRVIEAISQQDTAKQAKILAALPARLQDFTPQLLQDMVLPKIKALTSKHELAPLVLSPIMMIANVISATEFMTHVSDSIIPLMRLNKPRDTVRKCLMILIKALDVLLIKGDESFKRNELVPLLSRCFDGGNHSPQILSEVLKRAHEWSKDSVIEISALQTRFLPRLLRTVSDRTLSVSLRAEGLDATCEILKTCSTVDGDFITDKILPCLNMVVKTLGTGVGVSKLLMSLQKIYVVIASRLETCSEISRRVLAPLVVVTFHPSLKGSEFATFADETQRLIAEIVHKRSLQIEEKRSISQAASRAADDLGRRTSSLSSSNDTLSFSQKKSPTLGLDLGSFDDENDDVSGHVLMSMTRRATNTATATTGVSSSDEFDFFNDKSHIRQQSPPLRQQQQSPPRMMMDSHSTSQTMMHNKSTTPINSAFESPPPMMMMPSQSTSQSMMHVTTTKIDSAFDFMDDATNNNSSNSSMTKNNDNNASNELDFMLGGTTTTSPMTTNNHNISSEFDFMTGPPTSVSSTRSSSDNNNNNASSSGGDDFSSGFDFM